jgi:hypothetical protein
MGRPGNPWISWVGYPTQPNLLGWVPKAETPRVTRGLPRPMPNTAYHHLSRGTVRVYECVTCVEGPTWSLEWDEQPHPSREAQHCWSSFFHLHVCLDSRGAVMEDTVR